MKKGKGLLPMEHKEKDEGKLGKTSNLKYTEGMDNPAKLDKASEGLANFVKKNKMKY